MWIPERALKIILKTEKAMNDYIAELANPDMNTDSLIKIKNEFSGLSISLANAYWM